jgi:hypothetical protein
VFVDLQDAHLYNCNSDRNGQQFTKHGNSNGGDPFGTGAAHLGRVWVYPTRRAVPLGRCDSYWKRWALLFWARARGRAVAVGRSVVSVDVFE